MRLWQGILCETNEDDVSLNDWMQGLVVGIRNGIGLAFVSFLVVFVTFVTQISDLTRFGGGVKVSPMIDIPACETVGTSHLALCLHVCSCPME